MEIVCTRMNPKHEKSNMCIFDSKEAHTLPKKKGVEFLTLPMFLMLFLQARYTSFQTKLFS
jgi:hypothetical protein